MHDEDDDRRGSSASSGRTAPAAPGRHPRLQQLAHALGSDDDLPIDPDLGPEDRAGPSLAHRRTAHAGRRAQPAVLAATFAGGFLGTFARYGVGDAWPAAAGHFPTATFVINTSGAFLLGLLLTVLLERLRGHNRLVRPFAVTGVLGGWTTYSSLVVEAATLGHAGRLALAAGYLALTLVCGVAGVAFGIALGRSRGLNKVAAVAPTRWVPAAVGGRSDGSGETGSQLVGDAETLPGRRPERRL